jgi:hypothetical protein
MFVAEINSVSWLVCILGQVPNLEVFILINSKELTYSGSETSLVISEVLCTLEDMPGFLICHHFGVVEVEQTPLDLSNCKLSLVIPDSNGCCIIFVEKPIHHQNKLNRNESILTLSNRRNRQLIDIPCQTLRELLVNLNPMYLTLSDLK